MAVAAAGAEEGILCGQGLGLDSEDRVCARVLGRDGSAALAVAHKRALQAFVSTAGGGCCWGRLTVTSGSYSLLSFWSWANSSSGVRKGASVMLAVWL